MTFEARQAVKGLFGRDPSKIEGMILDSIVVLKGNYAMLENIDDDHIFKEDVEFYIGEQRRFTRKVRRRNLCGTLLN